MTRVGLISDTHGFLDPSISTHFSAVDQIWHLGDIGSEEVLESLKKVKPTKAVFGNIDSKALEWKLNENEVIELEGIRFLLRHIAAKPPKYNKATRDLIHLEKINVLICGHSHQKCVIKDRDNGIVFINPGAAGNQGFHKERYVMILTLDNKKITNLEQIKLGKR
jgi:putative phosphoesterase